MTWQDAGRTGRRTYEGSHPGWGWGVALVPLGVGLGALGVTLARALDTGMGALIGVALVAWGTTLVMPFVVIAWYAMQATWKATRERTGAEFAAPSSDLRRIGYSIRWSWGARSLMFGPASYDGRDLPMLVAGRIAHGLGLVVLMGAGVIAALVALMSR